MFQVTRDLSSIEANRFDVLIVGGGVVGCACALESSLLGLKTLLIDKSDFGSKTSTGCFKIVHGGLRYLQHFDLIRLRESVKEQSAMRSMAPHLVKPLPFLVPTYSKLSKSKMFLGCGVAAYEFLSFDKNRGCEKEQVLPFFSTMNKEKCLKFAPGLNPDGLTGAVVYSDAQMSHSERLTFAYAQTAATQGASICNYLELESAETVVDDKGSFSSYQVKLKDILGGNSLCVSALSVINAAGPWCSKVEGLFGVSPNERLPQKSYSKGVQVVLPQIIESHGIAIESEHKDGQAIVSRGGRSYFMHPWRGGTLLGTTDSIHFDNPDNFSISKQEVRELLHSAASRYKDPRISEENVRYAFGGLRQVAGNHDVDTDNHDSKVAMHPLIKMHSGLENFISVVGVKYTTCRSLAEKVVREVATELGMGSYKSKSSEVVLVGGQDLEVSLNECKQGFFASQVDSLSEIYGSQLLTIIEFAEYERKKGESNPFVCLAKAEIKNAVENEMAVSVEDVLCRRTSLAQAVVPDESIVLLAAEKLAELRFWSSAEVENEVSSFLKSFSLSE